MIFDQFCGLVEKHFPMLKDSVRDAKIFNFPAIPHEVLPKHVDVEFFKDYFFLPFQTVVIEDKASMIMLIDDNPNVTGLYEKRLFIECLPMESDWRFYGDSDKFAPSLQKYYDEMGRRYRGHYIVTIGIVKYVPNTETEHGYAAEGTILSCQLCSKNTIIPFTDFNPEDADVQTLANSALKNACTAIEEIMYFNMPDRFILEESPIAVKKSRFKSTGETKKILRSHDRPVYTLLTPREIREKLGIKSSHSTEGGTREGHHRRRHFRTLKSEKFTHKQHSVVIVKATWVGESELMRGSKRYKVMLDL